MVSGSTEYSGGTCGATIVVNCSASDETVGKDAYRKQLISDSLQDLLRDMCMQMQEMESQPQM